MAKVSKIMKLSFYNAQYSIEFHEGRLNPFRLYRHGYKPEPYEGGVRFKKTKLMIDKYANLGSAVLRMQQEPEYKMEAFKDCILGHSAIE